MEKIHKYSLKHILFIVLIFSLIFIQVSSEPINYSSEKLDNNQEKPSIAKQLQQTKRNNLNARKNLHTKKPKVVTPKKYRKNFVIRIPRTVYRPEGPKRITITKTTPPATIEYEIPTHTADETTTYYSTFAYDFISPSPRLSRIYRGKKSYLTTEVSDKKEPIPATKAP